MATSVKKTKAELIEELEARKEEIKVLNTRIETFERYEKYEEMGDELKAVYDAYVHAGFSEDQAFQLLTESLKAASAMLKNRICGF